MTQRPHNSLYLELSNQEKDKRTDKSLINNWKSHHLNVFAIAYQFGALFNHVRQRLKGTRPRNGWEWPNQWLSVPRECAMCTMFQILDHFRLSPLLSMVRSTANMILLLNHSAPTLSGMSPTCLRRCKLQFFKRWQKTIHINSKLAHKPENINNRFHFNQEVMI